MTIQQLDMSIELCNRIMQQIEADCNVRTNELGGKTLPAYEENRKKQVYAIKDIYKKMLTLRAYMSRI